MPSRLVAMAERGALEGGCVLKFAYDAADAERPLSIQTLSVTDQVRLYYHPHDRDRLLMARIQYPFFDASSGKTFWYREEWTGEREIHYVPASASDSARFNPDTFESWAVESEAPNPFGVIPLAHIRNLETDDVWGSGDLWDLYRIIDRANLDLSIWDRKNQIDAQLNPIWVDLEPEADDMDRPLAPGQSVAAESKEGKTGSVVFPPSDVRSQDAIQAHFKELLRMLYAAASSVDLDQAEVTNKGNLTMAVLEQLYQPVIEITHEKRKSYGDDGLERFFAIVARGLANLGVANLGATEDPASSRVSITWPDYFEMSEAERTIRTGRIQEQELAGFVGHSTAVAEISQMEGRDPEAIAAEIAAEPKPSTTETIPNASDLAPAMTGNATQGGNAGGAAANG
jgi:hypothetical protein